MENVTQSCHNAHKVACAVGRRLGIEICVRRMPCTKTFVAYEFVSGSKSAAFGQTFLDEDLGKFAGRLMRIFEGAPHGNTKSNASDKGKRV